MTPGCPGELRCVGGPCTIMSNNEQCIYGPKYNLKQPTCEATGEVMQNELHNKYVLYHNI